VTALVCGGRFYSDRAYLFALLDSLGPDKVVHGAAPGADLLAEQWAKSRQVPYAGYPARWNALGKAAGHQRNLQMPERELIDIVVAFPGGSGTADMVKIARRMGLPVLEA
jgi:hypothetical protein